ncbi:ribosome hibernation-promoting factor, HPF/YfiA family [Kordiimonas pumila]|uniref:Ribosome hibernation promoting factor n=1 Tax=Kordiimonas pumila TaxID=2161677 RepID=A0ABV7DAT2_9PROT|nr:ribosome-associated translation inhibitor RaiA [Kordiimonas pumila]
MEINVSGRKMNVGDALTTHVEDRLEAVADKYFSRTIDATATFAKEGHIYTTHVSFHANQGVNLQSNGEADDPYAAFELAAEKVEKQLRRYKRRLKNHHKTSQRDIAMELAHDITIAPSLDEESDEPVNGGHEDQPIIIAENRTEIPRVSVGDAVMLMDLADAHAFMFRNMRNDTLEVVYRRTDGNIGWISPKTAAN